jgi:RIO kinase 1
MPNEATLDKSVQWRIEAGAIRFRESSHQDTVDDILSAGLATDVVGLISAGKEANVFLAEYNGAPLAVKVFRLFRTSHRKGGPIKLDEMSYYAAHEFQMLHMGWKGDCKVPTPARRSENMLAMRYLGDEDGPSPRLKDVRLDDAEPFLEMTLHGVYALLDAGLVHGDLSAFNILVHDGEPWFIDFADSMRVDRLGWPPWQKLSVARNLLDRGLKALGKYFGKYGLTIDVEDHVERLSEKMGSARRWIGSRCSHDARFATDVPTPQALESMRLSERSRRGPPGTECPSGRFPSGRMGRVFSTGPKSTGTWRMPDRPRSSSPSS